MKSKNLSEGYVITSNGSIISINYRRTGKPKELVLAIDKEGYVQCQVKINGVKKTRSV